MTTVAPIAPLERRPVWALFLGLAGLTGLGWAWSLHVATAGHPGLPLGARVLIWTTIPLDVAILGGAGLVQLSAWEKVCLERCRALPVELRACSVHPVRAGVRHGVVSVLSCGVLMLVLLVVGAMNVAAMLLLTAFLIFERVAPPSSAVSLLGRLGGVGLLGWGGWLAMWAAGA